MFEDDYEAEAARISAKHYSERSIGEGKFLDWYGEYLKDALTKQATLDEQIIQYLEDLKDEPALNTLQSTMDNFGLTSDEISSYVRMWIDRQT